MGLFLSPFSGHAVGGGGGAGGPSASTPPPGMGDEAGQRIEVDSVNRGPLRLLRTTMNKHKPKFMKVVPPGQQRGMIAPPYAWDGRERDDWEYKLDKPIGEGEFDAPKPKDPRHARVDALHAELQQLKAEVHQLMSKQHELVQRGKSELGQRQKYAPGAGHTMAFGPKGKSDYITFREDPARTQEESSTPFGVRPSDEWGIPTRNRRFKTSNQDFVSPMVDVKGRARTAADNALLQRHHSSGQAKRDFATAPGSSAELIGVHQQLKQKRARIEQLTQELRQLRQQMKLSHESAGLNSNNLHRLSLLLK